MGRPKGKQDSAPRKRRSASANELSAKAGKKKKDGLTALSANDIGAQGFRALFQPQPAAAGGAAGGPVVGGGHAGTGGVWGSGGGVGASGTASGEADGIGASSMVTAGTSASSNDD
jgi:hypothetical protein